MSASYFTYTDANGVSKSCGGGNWTIDNSGIIDCDGQSASKPTTCMNVWGWDGRVGDYIGQPNSLSIQEVECSILALTDSALTITQRVELFTLIDAYIQDRLLQVITNKEFWKNIRNSNRCKTNSKGRGDCCCTSNSGQDAWKNNWEQARETYVYFLGTTLPSMQVALDEEIANVGDMMEIEADIMVWIEEMNRIREERNFLLAQQQSQEQTQVAQETISATLKWALPVVIGLGILLLFTKS